MKYCYHCSAYNCDCVSVKENYDMMPQYQPEISKAKTEKLSPGIEQIPFEALEACGEIFAEGEIKYGRDNWKKGLNDQEYQTERCRHAIRHLMKWANGDRSEPHLAKVMWFCVTQIWTEKQSE